jgi:hypothetical protein
MYFCGQHSHKIQVFYTSKILRIGVSDIWHVNSRVKCHKPKITRRFVSLNGLDMINWLTFNDKNCKVCILVNPSKDHKKKLKLWKTIKKRHVYTCEVTDELIHCMLCTIQRVVTRATKFVFLSIHLNIIKSEKTVKNCKNPLKLWRSDDARFCNAA